MNIESIKNTVICGDCLPILKSFPDKSVDLILTDPPYGMTDNEWDSTKGLREIFDECLRVLKDNSPLVFTAAEPFNFEAYNLLKKYYRHSWVWDKNFPGSFMNAKLAPLKIHENVMVFSKEKANYYPQMMNQTTRKKGRRTMTENYKILGTMPVEDWDKLYPKSIVRFYNGDQKNKEHPTQKPVDLMRYLLTTYSKEGNLILDPFLGSGTTAVAAKMEGRNFIGIEISQKYCDIANERLKHVTQKLL